MKHFDVKLPLIYLHTPFGLKFFDKVASYKITKVYAKFNIYLMPLITIAAMVLIIGSLSLIISNQTARETASSISPAGNLLIPGINPYLPITYGFIALVVTIVIHEVGHGIVARVYNIKVESTGVVFFLILPIGAFVNIKPEELTKSTMKQKSAILTAGPMNNMISAGISLILLYLVVSTLVPISTANVQSQMVLERYQNLFMTNPLATLVPPTVRQMVVPFSDVMSINYISPILGDMYIPLANMLFWFWFVNFNLGIFNALPIGPLDGGQLYDSFIKQRVKSKVVAKNANVILSITIVGIVIALMALPHLGVW